MIQTPRPGPRLKRIASLLVTSAALTGCAAPQTQPDSAADRAAGRFLECMRSAHQIMAAQNRPVSKDCDSPTGRVEVVAFPDGRFSSLPVSGAAP